MKATVEIGQQFFNGNDHDAKVNGNGNGGAKNGQPLGELRIGTAEPKTLNGNSSNGGGRRNEVAVSEIFEHGKAGDFFAAIKREPGKGGREYKAGGTTIEVLSEKLGIVSFTDTSDPDGPIKKTISDAVIKHGKPTEGEHGKNPLSFILPPEITSEGEEIFNVVQLTKDDAHMRPATGDEKKIAQGLPPRKFLEPEPGNDRYLDAVPRGFILFRGK